MSTNWNASARDSSDETWQVTRGVVNSQGRWQLERVSKIFRSYETAQACADRLNQK
jgi:hypothetical protein